MDLSSLRRHRVHLAVLLGVLVLLAAAERRLAYLDFDSATGVVFENSERPDGDEIFNRLVFVDDAAELVVPAISEACHAAYLPDHSNVRALIVVRLSDSRAPPFSASSLV